MSEQYAQFEMPDGAGMRGCIKRLYARAILALIGPALDVDFDRVMKAAHAAADLAEQQIERAERATASTRDLARRCQRQEEQIASLIAALGGGKLGRA